MNDEPKFKVVIRREREGVEMEVDLSMEQLKDVISDTRLDAEIASKLTRLIKNYS